MHIEHVALWTRDLESLERLRAFYATYFGAVAGPRYASQRRAGFASYFLTFPPVGSSHGCARAGSPSNRGRA